MDINVSAQSFKTSWQKATRALGTVRDTASAAVDYTKSEATRAINLSQDNPATTAVSLLATGLLSGLNGYVIGSSVQPSGGNRYWR